jgi:rhodanese-related sulfurtransferase
MTIHSVDAKTLQSWLQSNQAILIDVREISENQAARIKAASLIPLAIIDVDKLPVLNGKKLVIHCKSGKRSWAACERLLAQNPGLEIYNLDGGIDAWAANGLAVEQN